MSSHQKSLYQKLFGKRSKLDVALLLVVGVVAGFVIALSFKNTTKLAAGLSIPPWMLAVLIEITFAVLLIFRGRQRATKRYVPIFVHILYYSSFGLVTFSNMWGLYREDKTTGLVIGAAISCFMLGLEELMIFMWTKGDQPARKSPGQMMREAKKEIKEERILQKIEWMKWEAKKPDLKLVEQARKAEEKRKTVEGDRLPQFFLEREKEDPIKQIQAELKQTEPKIVDVDADVQTLPARRIGFHAEDERRVQSSVQTVQTKKKSDIAYEIAKKMHKQNHEVPSCRQIVKNAAEHNMKISVGTAKAGRDRLIEELNQ
jgi:hypothetical protein